MSEAEEKDPASRIEDLYTSISSDIYNKQIRIELIDLLNSIGFYDEAIEEQRLYFSLFSVSSEQWRSWINSAMNRGENKETFEIVVKGYELYLAEYPVDVLVWKEFLEFIVKGFDNNYIDEDQAKVYFAHGLDATGWHISSSDLVWDIYLQFHLKRLKGYKYGSSEFKEKFKFIKQIFISRLRIPHLKIDSTFEKFSNFVSTFANEVYLNELPPVSKICSNTKKSLSYFENFEDDISKSKSDEETESIFKTYLEYIKKRPAKFTPKELIITLYERSIKIANETLWLDYIYYLYGINWPYDLVDKTIDRSVKSIPKSGKLWAEKVRVLINRNNNTNSHDDEIETLKDMITQLGLLDIPPDAQPEEFENWKCLVLQLLRSYYNMAKNNLDAGILAVLFDYCDKFFNIAVNNEVNKADPLFEIERTIIGIYTKLTDIDQARLCFNKLTQQRNKESEVWLSWARWEISFDEIDQARKILLRAIARVNMDWPERIYQELTILESENGDEASFQTAIIKIRKQSKQVYDLRLKQYQQQQQQQQQQPILEELPRATEQHTVIDSNEIEMKVTKRTREGSNDQGPNIKKSKYERDTLPNKRNRENNTIIVTALPIDTTEKTLRTFFKQCGIINKITLIKSNEDENSKIASIEFENYESVLSALIQNNKSIDKDKGKEIKITHAKGNVIWVTNYPETYSDEKLRELFSSIGNIFEVRMPSLRFEQRRRFCYIEFSSSREAQLAVKEFNGKIIDDVHNLQVKISDPEKKTVRDDATIQQRKVFIKGIDFEKVDEKMLEKLFSKYGKIERIHLPLSPKNKRLNRKHNGIAFITFSDYESAKQSTELNKTSLEGRDIEVSIAENRNKNNSTITNGDYNTELKGDRSPEDIKLRTIGVLNLADTVNNTQVKQLFEQIGPVQNVTLLPDLEGALVEYEKVSDAGKAGMALEGSVIGGKQIKIGTRNDLLNNKNINDNSASSSKAKRPTMMIPPSLRRKQKKKV